MELYAIEFEGRQVAFHVGSTDGMAHLHGVHSKKKLRMDFDSNKVISEDGDVYDVFTTFKGNTARTSLERLLEVLHSQVARHEPNTVWSQVDFKVHKSKSGTTVALRGSAFHFNDSGEFYGLTCQ